MTKLEITIQLINKVQTTTPSEDAAKKKIIAAYTEQVSKLEHVPIERIRAYPYKTQIIQEAKLAKRTKALKEVTVKLERHLYAPELNCLHFKNCTTYKVKNRDFPAAINSAALNMSESQFQKAIKPVQI